MRDFYENARNIAGRGLSAGARSGKKVAAKSYRYLSAKPERAALLAGGAVLGYGARETQRRLGLMFNPPKIADAGIVSYSYGYMNTSNFQENANFFNPTGFKTTVKTAARNIITNPIAASSLVGAGMQSGILESEEERQKTDLKARLGKVAGGVALGAIIGSTFTPPSSSRGSRKNYSDSDREQQTRDYQRKVNELEAVESKRSGGSKSKTNIGKTAFDLNDPKDRLRYLTRQYDELKSRTGSLSDAEKARKKELIQQIAELGRSTGQLSYPTQSVASFYMG